MPRTLRSRQYQMAQARQRTSQPFAHFEAPVGGWNTRDSIDNIAPTDALTLDNWWPDIGEVRTRPGYIEHCSLANAVTGSDLVSNGSFETAGAGGLDVFANWTEAAAVGAAIEVSRSTDLVHTGTYACKWVISRKPLFNPTELEISQDITVSASTSYRLQFYDTTTETNSGVNNSLKYSVYDNDHSADLIAWTETGHVGSSYSMTTVVFDVPAGCTSVKIKFKNGFLGSPLTGGDSSNAAYLDVVMVYELVAAIDSVDTLAEFIKGSTRDLLAFSGTEAFKVNSSTPVHLSSALGDFTNAKFQWANFDGKMGLVNGYEKLQWDGTSLTALTIDDGVDPITPIGVNVFKNRTWFWEADSQDVWYSALSTLGGSCTSFPLSRVGQFGGNLVLMETWTRDGGSGPDDFAVFVMSSGEALVYQGSSPSVGGDWALVGIYNIGEPIGYRSAVKFGGDLFILTRLDVVRMSEVISGVEARQMESKIVQAHRTAVSLYKEKWGWDATIYPEGHMAIFNIPVTEYTDEDSPGESEQHVQNTITGAWTRFKDVLSFCWQNFDGDIFFGSSGGKIYEFDSGEDDDGDAIESTFQTAWLPIGGLGANKLFKALREAYRVNASINVDNTFAVDFQEFASQTFPASIDSSDAEWDVAIWDVSLWTSADRIVHEWRAIGTYGERISMRKSMSTKQKVTYLGMSWLYEIARRL
jgi:hypothetical protein